MNKANNGDNSLQKRTENSLQQDSFYFNPHHTFEGNSSTGNVLDPRNIVLLLLQYKWAVMFFVLAGTTAAWFYANNVTPIYESHGTIMISPNESKNEDISAIISQATGYGTSSTLENEMQILQSRTFSRQVFQKLSQKGNNLHDTYPILWEEVEDGTYIKAEEDKVVDQIQDNLELIQEKEESDVIKLTFRSSSPTEAKDVVNLAMENYVENSTQQNRKAAESTTEFLGEEKEKTKEKLETAEEKLRQFMDNSGIVQVDEQAANLVNERSETETELQRIKLELQTIKETIANYENELENIKPGLSEQFSEAIGPRIRSSQEQLANYENEKTLIIAKNPGVLDRNPLPNRLQYLNEQIDRLKGEIKSMSSKLFSKNNEFLGMDTEERAEKVAEIEGRLIELRIQQNQYVSRRDALAKHKQEMDSSFNALPQDMIKLAKLKRDVRINEEMYTNVSKKYADMSAWKESQFGFGRIIDYAMLPEIPVSPNKKIFILLGIMLGGLMAASYIFIKEFNDNSVKSADQLRTYYLPSFSLTTIPIFDKGSKSEKKHFPATNREIPDEMVMLNNNSSSVSEAIRRLKNNLIYQHGDTPPKTIAVTSPEKGDGKSTIVANLGVAFAEEGFKTLIIDADFHRPKLQKYFGLMNTEGLADYLDAKISIQELIKSSSLNSLQIVTAGKVKESPESIGSSILFRQFLNKMEDIYEVILIDTPPFGIISDSAALLKNADVTVVVARHRKTNKGMLLRTIDELGRIKANVVEIVLNGFDHKKEMGPSYGTGYYKTLYSSYEEYVS